MAVFLSPVGGAAAQFFDNNGVPLTGGKLFTYAGGTTTPQVSYTSIAGDVAHTNPIILDSAGRVPGGEIWLTDQSYKFVLNDADNVLIATYDNIFAIPPVSALNAATTPLTGSEILSIVQSGTTVKVSVANLTAGRAISASAATITGAVSAGSATITGAVNSASAAITGAVTASSAAITNNSASAALQIIQTGAGDALLIEDSASPDATPFVVKADGNVGIGTNSPGASLHVAGEVIGAPTGSGALLGILGGIYGVVKLQGSTGSALDFSTSGSTFKGRIIYNNAENSLAFSTDSAERMRLTNTGNLYIGLTTPVAGAKVAVDWNASTQYGLVFRTTNATYNAGPILFLNSVGVASGNISQSESVVSYNTSSDYRLKENVLPMTGALAKVAALKPCTYKWKVDGSAGQGFIAHQLQEVIPDCVTGEKDAVDKDGNIRPQGVDTSFLVATLTAAIQEQQAMIVQLQADVAALKSTN